MLLRRHNLNDLPILRELLRSCSVSRTAAAVGLGQSAVSSALARLRIEFNDDLLVMEGRRMVRTVRAEALVEPVERACAELETVLQGPDFAPERESRRFIIATADYVSFLLAPPLARIMGEEAPETSVQFVEYPADIDSSLTRGQIDLVALPAGTSGDMKDRYSQMALFDDESVVISSQSHKPFSGELTREIYEAARHAMFHLPPEESTSHEAMALKHRGIRQRNRVLVEHFLTLPAIVEASSCLALVQRRLAEAFQRSHAIEIHRPPFTVPPLRIASFWARRSDRDPAHRWFRDALRRAAQDIC